MALSGPGPELHQVELVTAMLAAAGHSLRCQSKKVCFIEPSCESIALFDFLSGDLSTDRPNVARGVPTGARDGLGPDPRPPPGRRVALERVSKNLMTN